MPWVDGQWVGPMEPLSFEGLSSAEATAAYEAAQADPEHWMYAGHAASGPPARTPVSAREFHWPTGEGPGFEGEFKNYDCGPGMVHMGFGVCAIDPNYEAPVETPAAQLWCEDQGGKWLQDADGNWGCHIGGLGVGGLPLFPGEGSPYETPSGLPGDENETASSIIRDALKDYGLEGLLDDTNLRLIDRWVETGDMDAVWAAVRETATYQRRFPGMQALMDAGRAITEGTYVELERHYTSALRAYGMPETFYDSPDDFAALIGGDVSVNEFTQRVATAFQAANQTTPEVRTALETYYGLNDSDLAAYYLDPERAQNIFEERERLGTARIGGIAAETGFGTIARETAERLREAGVTDAQARRGFQAVAQSTLAEETVGDVGDITRAELVGDVFGTDPEAARRVEERRQRRLAEFNQAGGPAMTQGGYVGLGAAT